MDKNKIELGQFFTKKEEWLQPQVRDFIVAAKCACAYDPFAGAGDLLKAVDDFEQFTKFSGLDIDPMLGWRTNDSLDSIPHVEDAIIITNPPYLAKQSASRKGIDLSKYFSKSDYVDLYLIALDRMIEAQKYVVAIIPESFINSRYKRKDLLHSITVLEANPFTDTEAPVCVACFDGISKDLSEVAVYKNSEYVNDLRSILSIRLVPENTIKIKFNDLSGWLGLRAVDSTNDNVRISFDFKENINYDWENNIRVSSRHITLINVDIPAKDRGLFIQAANSIIESVRKESADVLLTPFKGNTRLGHRRRRLDYSIARAILERAYSEIYGEVRLV